MSTPFDNVFRGVGKDLIQLFGVQQGGSDPVKGEYTSIGFSKVNKATGETTNNTDVQTLDMSPPLRVTKQDLTPTLIEATDSFVIISGIDWDAAYPSTKPKANDIITVNGDKFRVLRPNPIVSGNLVAVYKIFIRDAHA